jgi:hypothetical protein
MEHTREELSDIRGRAGQHRREVHRKDIREERALHRDTYTSDVRRSKRASRLATAEIEADPAEVAGLRRATQQAQEGKLISQDELDRELQFDDE